MLVLKKKRKKDSIQKKKKKLIERKKKGQMLFTCKHTHIPSTFTVTFLHVSKSSMFVSTREIFEFTSDFNTMENTNPSCVVVVLFQSVVYVVTFLHGMSEIIIIIIIDRVRHKLSLHSKRKTKYPPPPFHIILHTTKHSTLLLCM
jgi:hypothetical protein